MSKKRRPIPVFNHAIIETHCHLDYLEAQALADTLDKCRETGIERIITIAVSPDNLDTVLNIARNHEQIWCTQGIHPHEAQAYNASTQSLIQANLSEEKVVAVGEIGLDYYYDHAERSVQQAVFEQQLQIAVDHDLPVVIHTRDADDDTQAILKNFSGKLRRSGVIHSFTSSIALAEFCLSEGFSLGFNGITTFNRAENVRDVVRITPVEKILLETDAPYLTPVPYRGKENAPFYLPFIAENLAQLKETAIETLLAQVFENSMALFFPPDASCQ